MRTAPNDRFVRQRAGWGLILASLLTLIPSCGAQQRAAEKLIDPQLRSEGVLVERQRGARDLELGRYRVEGVELVDEPFDGSGPLGPDAAGRTRPTQQLRLRFTLGGGVSRWIATCVGHRRQPPDADLAAVADERRDEVALRCEIGPETGEARDPEAGDAPRWVLEASGDLGDNVLGRLERVGDEGDSRVVEVVMWHRLWNISRRRLPAALALIRGDEGTEAALILDRPERAWLDPALDDDRRELALTAMLALRLIPLGFDE